MAAIIVRGGRQIDGETGVPGDKSISHRALLVGAIARGRSVVRGLSPGEDVASTATCLRGYSLDLHEGKGQLEIEGERPEGWPQPAGPLDCGNSGSTMRMLAGLAARAGVESVLDGDLSLRNRPMERVARPLRELGAQVRTTDGRPPVTIRGGALHGAEISTGVPSAQVKSAVILAALGASGTTTVVEPVPTRDHTERMLAAVGARIEADGSRVVVEPSEPSPFDLDVPGDPSSAAFLVAAALLAGRVRIDGVLLNPTRTGFLEAAVRMGCDVRSGTTEERMGEPVGWIEARRSSASGIGLEGPAMYASIADELPLLAVLATQAHGPTVVTGAEELRIKESDRIATIVSELTAMGAKIAERPDGFEIDGPVALHGATVRSHGDHRIAMALAVAALAAEGETRIEGWRASDVSWPGFDGVLRALGAEVRAG